MDPAPPRKFVWKAEWALDIESIDAQHRRLVSLLGDLEEAMASGRGRAVLGTILSRVRGYTETHFAHEEAYMKRMKYPDYEEHKKLHESLLIRLAELEEDYRQNKPAITIKIMHFLSQWLLRHILESDRDYANHSKGAA